MADQFQYRVPCIYNHVLLRAEKLLLSLSLKEVTVIEGYNSVLP